MRKKERYEKRRFYVQVNFFFFFNPAKIGIEKKERIYAKNEREKQKRDIYISYFNPTDI